jgi:hypothetical protein
MSESTPERHPELTRRDLMAAGLAAGLVGGSLVAPQANANEADDPATAHAQDRGQGQTASNPLAGRWRYQSYQKDTLEKFVEGELEIENAPLGVFTGRLSIKEPTSVEMLALNGQITLGNPFTVHFRGVGTTPGAKTWETEYEGYIAHRWVRGVENTEDSLVGTWIRVKDIDATHKAGYVALWVAIRQKT